MCHGAGWLLTNPTQGLKPGSSDTKMPDPYTKGEQAHILKTPQDAKTRCFVHILHYSALRISDVCMLKPTDFDASKIRRVNKKNKKRIVFIPIPPSLKAELDQLPL